MKFCRMVLFVFSLKSTFLFAGTYLEKHTPNLFVENKGQVKDASQKLRPDVLFKTSGIVSVYLRQNGLTYVQAAKQDAQTYITTENSAENNIHYLTHRVDVDFQGCNQPKVIKKNPSDYFYNYYLGHCKNGITNVRAYQQVTYQDIYDSIDVVFYSGKSSVGMEYDFIVKSGANPDVIKLSYKGDDGLELKNGKLIIKTSLGNIEEYIPLAYQLDDNGRKEPIKAVYILKPELNEIAFNVSKYDKSKPLVIDPWVTYMGGAASYSGVSPADDISSEIAVDDSSNVLVTGFSYCIDLPATPGVFQSAHAGFPLNPQDIDAFVLKTDKDGNLKWLTYVGGASERDYAYSITTDNNYSIYIAGQTASDDYPTTSGVIQSFSSNNNIKGFVTKFNNNGGLDWSTYLHENTSPFSLTYCTDVEIDKNNNVVLTGFTSSTDFISQSFGSAYIDNSLNGATDCFISVLNSSASSTIWSTLYGGNGNDHFITGSLYSNPKIKLDANGNLYLTGTTASTNLPVPNAIDNSLNGAQDAFVTRFDKNYELKWGTYFGGTVSDQAYDITVDNNMDILVTGRTNSGGIATSGAYQTSGTTLNSAYVLKMDSMGNRLWSTYFRGSTTSNNIGFGIAADYDNNVLLTGFTTSSTNISSASAYQPTIGGAGQDNFFAKLNSSGTARLCGTYIGGSDQEPFCKIAINCGSQVYLTGHTPSTNMPVTPGVFQSNNKGSNDVWIARLCADCSGNDNTLTVSANRTICNGDMTTISAFGPSSVTWYPSTGLSSSTGLSVIASPSITTTYIAVSSCSDCNNAFVTITVNSLPSIQTAVPSGICDGRDVTLEALHPGGGPTNYYWSPSIYLESTTGNSVMATFPSPGLYNYTVVGIDANDCKDTVPVSVTILALPTASVSNPISVCPGIPSPLASSGGDAYEWQPSTGLNFTNQQNVTATLHTPGLQNYTVIVTAPNSCIDTAYTSIFVYTPPLLMASDNIPLCTGDSTNLTASGNGINYSWLPITNLSSNTGNTIIYTAATAGAFTYSVTTVDENDCSSTVMVNINVVSGVTANAGSDKAICEGEYITLNGTGTGSYSWAPTSTLTGTHSANPVASPNVTTQYTLTITAGSCSDSDTVSVTVYPLPTIKIANNDTSIFKGQGIQLYATGGNSYQWTPESYLDNPSITNPLASPQETITYTLIGTDNVTNCSNTDIITINILLPLCSNLYVPNAFSPNNDGQNDVLFVENKNCELASFSFVVFDRWGNKLFESFDIKKGWDGKINNQHFETGVCVYILTYASLNGDIKTLKGNISLIE